MSFLGENTKKLGFGLMRLPEKSGQFDMPQFCRMVDKFIENGFSYFDTAYVYYSGRSEAAAKEAIVRRHPRDSFTVTSKLAGWMCQNPEDSQKMFDTSLSRMGSEYFDYYLLHAMGEERIEHYEKIGAWELAAKMKAEGKIKHVGFSFHDKADVLDKILTMHPESEFVQLQINYVDWDSKDVQSRLCYEVARKHNKPIVIMEPVKGGALAQLPDSVHQVFAKANPNMSTASWALRFAASLEGVITVLSGMSNIEQMEDNISFMKDFTPLADDERRVIAKALDEINKIDLIPCTACRYCQENCPKEIDTPNTIRALNRIRMYNDLRGARQQYGMIAGGKKADDCIDCGVCESVCPQKLPIRKYLEKARKTFA